MNTYKASLITHYTDPVHDNVWKTAMIKGETPLDALSTAYPDCDATAVSELDTRSNMCVELVNGSRKTKRYYILRKKGKMLFVRALLREGTKNRRLRAIVVSSTTPAQKIKEIVKSIQAEHGTPATHLLYTTSDAVLRVLEKRLPKDCILFDLKTTAENEEIGDIALTL